MRKVELNVAHSIFKPSSSDRLSALPRSYNQHSMPPRKSYSQHDDRDGPAPQDPAAAERSEKPALPSNSNFQPPAAPPPRRARVQGGVLAGALGATMKDNVKRVSGYHYKRPDGTLVGGDEPLSAAALLAAVQDTEDATAIQVRKVNLGVNGRFLPFNELRVAIERAAAREAVEKAE